MYQYTTCTMHTACIYLRVFMCIPTVLLLTESILNNYQQMLGWKVLQRITFLWPFGKNLVYKVNLKSFFPTQKICHNKFDPVFDPSKDIMFGH